MVTRRQDRIGNEVIKEKIWIAPIIKKIVWANSKIKEKGRKEKVISQTIKKDLALNGLYVFMVRDGLL